MIRVLIVDDDPMQRQLLERVMRDHFDEVTTADQFDAYIINWCYYDVVIVDVLMPVHDGPSLIRRCAGQCGKLPKIVLYSAISGEPLRAEVGQLNDVIPVYHITKTSTRLARLVEILRELST